MYNLPIGIVQNGIPKNRDGPNALFFRIVHLTCVASYLYDPCNAVFSYVCMYLTFVASYLSDRNIKI